MLRGLSYVFCAGPSTALIAGVAVAVAVVSRRRHVEGRVAVEESDRLEREPRVGDGRHRPVFGADDVMDAEAVPEHDVRVHQSAIGLHPRRQPRAADRKSTRLNSSHGYISYAVFCLKKKKKR